MNNKVVTLNNVISSTILDNYFSNNKARIITLQLRFFILLKKEWSIEALLVFGDFWISREKPGRFSQRKMH